VALLPKTPVQLCNDFAENNLKGEGEGCGMRLLAYGLILSYSRQQRYPSHQYPTHNFLIKNKLPIASNISKSKFNQKDLEIIEPTKKICVRCPTNASLLDLMHNKCVERDVC
jgi:hypothetical protein